MIRGPVRQLCAILSKRVNMISRLLENVTKYGKGDQVAALFFVVIMVIVRHAGCWRLLPLVLSHQLRLCKNVSLHRPFQGRLVRAGTEIQLYIQCVKLEEVPVCS
jgi:hypothetical protein